MGTARTGTSYDVADSIDQTNQGHITLQLGVQTSHGVIQLFDYVTPIYLLTRESLNEPASYRFVVEANQADFVNKTLKEISGVGIPIVKIRLGVKTQGLISWFPWQDHILVGSMSNPVGIGDQGTYYVRIDTADLLWVISQKSKIATRKGSVSDVVETIARENDLKSPVIEPTVGRGQWVQSFIDDMDFVKNRMLIRAVNAKGRGNYRIFMKDGIFHFHTPDFKPTVKKFDYLASGRGITLEFNDVSQEFVEHGAAGVQITSHNPYTAGSGTVSSDPEKTLRFGSFSPKLSKWRNPVNLGFHRSASNLEIDEPQFMAQNTYELHHCQLFNILMVTRRTINLQLNDMLKLTVDQDRSRTSPWSGWWNVSSVSHFVDKGALTSKFVLTRGELLSAPNSTDSAPGQDLRLAEQDQELVYGKSASRKVSIIDANVLPTPE